MYCSFLKKLTAHLVLATFLFSFSHTALAATVTWDSSGGSALWSYSGNWDTGSVPTSSDTVIFDDTSTQNCTIDACIDVANLTFDSAYTGSISFDVPPFAGEKALEDLSINGSDIEVFCLSADNCKAVYMDDGSNLQFADCNNATCSSPTITTIDSSAATDIGLYCIADDNCKVTFVSSGTNEIEFIDCDNATCSSKTTTSIDTPTTVQGSAVYCLSDTDCKIVYDDNGDLNFVDCDDATCSTNTITTVESAGTSGKFPTIDCPATDNCKIVYRHHSDQDVKFVDCDNATCSSNTITTLDSDAGLSAQPQIHCLSDTNCKIAYFDDGVDYLKFVDCDNATCSSNTITTLDNSVDPSQYVDIHCVADDNCKVINYLNLLNSIKFYNCSNATCSSSTTSTPVTNANPSPMSVHCLSDSQCYMGRYHISSYDPTIDYACTALTASTNFTIEIDITFPTGVGITAGALSISDPTNDSSDVDVVFGAGTTITVTTGITLNGLDSDDEVNLTSTTSGTAWNLDLQADTQSADYTTVKDSDASAGFEADCLTNCTNVSGNTNWSFGGGGNVISNLPSGNHTVVLASDNTTDLESSGQSSSVGSRFKESGITVVDVTIDYSGGNVATSDLTIDADSANNKAVVDLTNLGEKSGTHTLYIVKGSTSIVRVCPEATSLAQVNSSCTNGVTGSNGDTLENVGTANDTVTVSVVSIGGTQYWSLAGLTGSGGQGEGGAVPEMSTWALLVLLLACGYYVWKSDLLHA